MKLIVGKFSLKVNVIPNGLGEYMSFSVNKNLSFIDIFQFLRPSLHSLVTKLNKDDFNYLSQEFYNNVLDIVKQNAFYLYYYTSGLEKFLKNYLANKSFIIR